MAVAGVSRTPHHTTSSHSLSHFETQQEKSIDGILLDQDDEGSGLDESYGASRIEIRGVVDVTEDGVFFLPTMIEGPEVPNSFLHVLVLDFVVGLTSTRCTWPGRIAGLVLSSLKSQVSRVKTQSQHEVVPTA